MLIVRHTQRFKGKLSRVTANNKYKLRKIKVKINWIMYLQWNWRSKKTCQVTWPSVNITGNNCSLHTIWA